MVNSTPPYLTIVDYLEESKWETLVYTGTPSTSRSSHQPAVISFTTSESGASVEYQTHELLKFDGSTCFVLSGMSMQGCYLWKKLSQEAETKSQDCPEKPQSIDACNSEFEECKKYTEEQCSTWL
ncbi:uncharacterized protein LOC142584301 isoform X2 [Dermacentor variabilis]